MTTMTMTMGWNILRSLPALALGMGLLFPGAATAQATPDRAGVERAAMDYLDGFYEGDPDKLRRSVSPDVVKYGYYRENGHYEGTPMSFAQMIEFANNVRTRGNFPAADAPKRVEILDVLDQTAVAKVFAWWGSDYLAMAKVDGRWMIAQVLWQSPPRGS